MPLETVDVDECLDVVNPPCGTKEQHATCTNTVGSYTCKCGEGYEGSGYNGDCKLIPYCSDSKLNDCDPVFATCALKDGSYECTCKAGLEGDGIVGSCKGRRERDTLLLIGLRKFLLRLMGEIFLLG